MFGDNGAKIINNITGVISGGLTWQTDQFDGDKVVTWNMFLIHPYNFRLITVESTLEPALDDHLLQ